MKKILGMLSLLVAASCACPAQQRPSAPRINVAAINGARYADAFPGSTPAQQIQNAISDCAPGACTVVIPADVGGTAGDFTGVTLSISNVNLLDLRGGQVHWGFKSASANTVVSSLSCASAVGCDFAQGLTSEAAISGPVQDRGGQVFNVLAYGASPSLADNSAAINSAWAAAVAVHGEMFIPAGTFVTTSPLNFTGITGARIEGAAVSSRDNPSSKIEYEGSALSGKCPFEFTNDDWIEVDRIAFQSSVAVACQVLLGSASGQSEDMRFVDDSFQDGGVTVATVADFGGEVYSFVDGTIYQDGLIGTLFSSNGGSGYGIASNFGYTFGAHSMTQITFRGTKMVEGTGHNLELDGTGAGIPVADISLFGTYMSGTATGSVGIYGKGTILNLTDEGQRYEIDSATGEAAFLSGATGTTFENVRVDGLDISSADQVWSMYSISPNTVDFVGGRINGAGADNVLLFGNLDGFTINDPDPLSINVTGNAMQDTFNSLNGITTFSVSGTLLANINGTSNVVWFASLFSAGSSTFTLPALGASFYVFSYNGNSCSFTFAADVAASGNYVVSGVNNSDSAGGTLTCPVAGSGATAPTVSATYTTTGGFAVGRIQ